MYQNLKGKKILLGISGGIAAFKTPLLVRLLVKSGAEVRIVVTPSANQFVTKQTLSTLSGNRVEESFFNNDGTWNNHVAIAEWADVMIIAPCTANTLAKISYGLCDNLLSAVFLSLKCKCIIAPAMDLDMYQHQSTQDNLSLLKNRGVEVLYPNDGELASGLVGKGRMQEPEEIIHEISRFFTEKKLLNKNVLITSGPTYEYIDPVRFIGNISSGKMGVSIANTCAMMGARVTLVHGNIEKQFIDNKIDKVEVTSAEEMYNACMANIENADIIIKCAAVADYKPKVKSNNKIKKNNDNLFLELEKNKDILATIGKQKKENQILVGFALETNNEIEHAIEKLNRKNLDLIVLNSLNDKGAGFKNDTNKITIINKNGAIFEYPLKSKVEVATDIINKIYELL